MLYFYAPWKHHEAFGFMMFSGGVEMKKWNIGLKQVKEHKILNLTLVIKVPALCELDFPSKSQLLSLSKWGLLIKEWINFKLSNLFMEILA